MNNLKKCHYVLIAVLAVVFMILIMASVSEVHAVSKPVINNKGITTWDCVYFGHYPQSSNGKGAYNNDPIKWRVLDVNGDDAYLIADSNIDSMPYCDTTIEKFDCLWHESTVRSWLNGYDASSNIMKIDYTNNNFLNKAFTEAEQDAILTTEVETTKYTEWHFKTWVDYWGYSIVPNDIYTYSVRTPDKIAVLSFYEMLNKDYGFTEDEEESITRVARNTAFTASGGTSRSPYMSKEGVADAWLLRSPGEYSMYADMLTDTGEYLEDISDVNPVNVSRGIRPVLHLDLSKTDVWSDAGQYTAREKQTITVGTKYEKKYGDADFDLKAKTTGDSVLTYKSDDETVAAVSASGIVTIKGTGQAKITVTAPMTDSFEEASKEILINVKKGSRKIECADVEMSIDDEPAMLDVTTDKDAVLSYGSSDTSTVSVSPEGILTPLKAGNAEITISAPEDNKYTAAEKKVKVTVNKGVRIIECKDVEMTAADKAKALPVSVDEGVILSYESSDPSVVSVSSDGMLTPHKAGNAVITVTSAEDDKYAAATASAKVTVNKAAASVSVKKKSAAFKVKNLKKKAQTFSIGPSCKSGGKITCAKKSGHKYLTITKAGKVTVKKGAKKGSYSMKVKVSSAATAKYKAASKVFTIKVKIK